MQVNNSSPNIVDVKNRALFLKNNSTFGSFFNIEHFTSMHQLSADSTNLKANNLVTSMPSLINGTSDCLQCYYGLQLDSYVNGCSHDCVYCWAKQELTKLNSWNNPRAIPIDITSIWQLFYEAFETDKKSSMINLLRKKVPLRLGSMSDPFLSFEKKYQSTLEILKILKHYDYPLVILTRSSAVCKDEYLKLMDSHRVSVQFSIPSLDNKLVKIIEPGASSPIERLEALKTLTNEKIWSSIRLNPLFPNRPDGYYSQNKKSSNIKFNFFELDMIDQMADYGCRSLLTGFVHMNRQTMNTLSLKLEFPLESLLKNEIKDSAFGFKFSMEEIRCYYEMIQQKCKTREIEFSTCYLGLGESFFWKDQNLWADKKDCCNIKNHVEAFKTDTREIKLEKRLDISSPEMTFLKKIFFPLWFFRIKSFFLRNLWE